MAPLSAPADWTYWERPRAYRAVYGDLARRRPQSGDYTVLRPLARGAQAAVLAWARVTKEQDFDPAYAQRQHVGAPSSRTLNALPDSAVHTPVAPP